MNLLHSDCNAAREGHIKIMYLTISSWDPLGYQDIGYLKPSLSPTYSN